MERLNVDDSLDLKRLDVALSTHEKISSRSEAKKLIQEGRVQIDNSSEKITPRRLVKSGDVVTFSVPSPPEISLVPVPHKLDIIFEDDSLIIVNKPANMVVHPSVGHHTDTLVNYLLYHTTLSEKDDTRPGIVHRIDKDTSGILVVAKNNTVHDKMARLFHDHSISRTYQAIVWGVPKEKSGVIDQPLGRHPTHRKKFSVRPNGKRAVTHWRVLEPMKCVSLLECELETGRTHQIRVHLSSIGHSLVGDQLYGGFRQYALKLPDEHRTLLRKFPRQALHAKNLGFDHPVTGQPMFFNSPLPEDIKSLLTLFRQLRDET